MTLDAQLAADIARLHYVEHFPVGTIAAQVNVHPEVVRRILELPPQGPPSHEVTRCPTLAPYSDFIRQTLQQYPSLRATRIFDMLCERGYPGSTRTVRRYVATVRPKGTSQVYLRTHPLVGEQAQVDWAYVGKVPVPGGVRALWVFVMVLCYSRALWAELVLDLSVHSLRRSLCRAVSFFGGCTRQWLFDNPKIVVLERHRTQARFQPLLLELCGALRVQPRLCAVRAPEQKGGVERAVRYLRDRFFAGRTILDVESGNQQLQDFLLRIPPERPHPHLGPRTVAQVFAQEQAFLLPLPDPMPCVEQVLPVPVDKTAFVRFDTNSYSVPPAYAHKTLTLCASDQQVRLLYEQTPVAQHPRCFGKRQCIEDPAHREELLAHKHQARAPKGRDRLRAAVPGIDELFETWLLLGRNIGSLTLRTLKLLDLYGDAIVQEAVAEALSRGTCDFGALCILCERRRREKGVRIPLDIPLSAHVPDHDVIPHALEHYDEK